MTDEKNTLPQSGGSYVRLPDGQLIPADEAPAPVRDNSKKGK